MFVQCAQQYGYENKGKVWVLQWVRFEKERTNNIHCSKKEIKQNQISYVKVRHPAVQPFLAYLECVTLQLTH